MLKAEAFYGAWLALPDFVGFGFGGADCIFGLLGVLCFKLWPLLDLNLLLFEFLCLLGSAIVV